MARSLEEQLNGADPEPWIAEDEGDSIFGEIEAVSTGEGDYGKYPLITVIDADGEVWNIAGFGTVLSGKLEGLTDSDIGRQIGVKFLGEKTPKGGGKAYKNWRVVLGARQSAAVGAGVDDFPEGDDI